MKDNRAKTKDAEELARVTKRAFAIVWLFMLFETLRPHDMLGVKVPGISWILLAATAGLWLSKGNRAILKDGLVRAGLFFVFAMALTVIVTVNQHWWLTYTRGVAMDILVFAVAGATFLGQARDLSRLLRWYVMFAVVLAGWAMAHKGTGPGSFIGDENDVAFALCTALPYAWFFAQSPLSTAMSRLFHLGAAGAILLGIVATDSRGGFLGAAMACLSVLLFSPNKLRNALIAGIFGVIVLSQVGEDYWKEMDTINNTKDETREERLYSWRRSWEMFLDSPIIGVGVGNWGYRVWDYQVAARGVDPRRNKNLSGRVAHSLPFSLISEMGLVGLCAFATIVTIMVRRLFGVRSRLPDYENNDEQRELLLMSRGMIASLLGLLVTSLFISVLYYPHFWVLLGFVTILHEAVKRVELTSPSRAGAQDRKRSGSGSSAALTAGRRTTTA